MQLLYAPPGSDLVIAGTTKRQLLVWQYNPHAAHRYATYCHQDGPDYDGIVRLVQNHQYECRSL